MYNLIKTRNGDVLILKKLMGEVEPLFNKCIVSINHQTCEESLLCWLVDIFSEDFAEEFGQYSQEHLEKFTLCVLNARHYLVNDSENFCYEFNQEGLSLQIGFDNTYYPVDNGHWYDKAEFVLINTI